MTRYMHYPCDPDGVSPGEGYMEADPRGSYVAFREVEALARSAERFLASDHIQKNKHRMGALGAQDIDNALAAIRALTL